MSEAISHMKMQMEEKDRVNHQKRQNYNDRVKESMDQEKEYKSMQQKLKTEKMLYQEDYANVLKQQMQTKATKTLKYQTDQRETSKQDNSHLIPGLYNLASVGTRAIYRTGVIIANSPPIGGMKYEEKQNHKSNDFRYNPITNQIPMLTSNPYIIKEMLKSKQQH